MTYFIFSKDRDGAFNTGYKTYQEIHNKMDRPFCYVIPDRDEEHTKFAFTDKQAG